MPVQNSASIQNDSKSSKLQQKTKIPKDSKPILSQMEITSYLPKVKHQKNNTKAKEETNIEDTISAKTGKEAAENIESMSLEERELVKKKILAASNIACSLVYVDGSTLLRPSTTRSLVSMSSKAHCLVIFAFKFVIW